MKCFLLFLTGCGLILSACSGVHKITKKEAAGLDTISNINLLKEKQRAIYKNALGEYYIMRYVEDPGDSLESESDSLVSPGGNALRNGGRFTYLLVNSRCDSEVFDGSNRKDAKISISAASLQSYATLRSFVNTLRAASQMADSIRGTNSPRIPDEDRNVRIKKAYLYAYSRQTDEDFHVIIGSTKNPGATTRYFNVEVSGLPPNNSPAFAIIGQVRQVFLTKASQQLCSSGYFFYEHPLKVEITGSLFFDKQHHNGLIGPAEARPPDAWEIHPVTGLVFK